MKRVQYDLDFKMNIIQKGKEIGNLTAVARQHELDPKMVLRWARELKRKDVDQLDGASKRQVQFIPTSDFQKVRSASCHCRALLSLLSDKGASASIFFGYSSSNLLVKNGDHSSLS